MAKQPDNKKRLEKQRQEQNALNKVYHIFILGIAAECYLLLMYNRYVNGTPQQLLTMASVITWLGYIGAVAFVGGAIMSLVKTLSPIACKVGHWMLGCGGFFALSSLILYNIYPDGTTFLCVLVPILTVLGLVYYLFQREFFLTTVIMSGSIFTLWVCRKGLGTQNWNTKVTLGAAVVLIGIAAVAFVTWQVEKKNGHWIGAPNVRIFSTNCPYKLLYATYLVCFLTIALAFVVVTTTYYTMWLLGLLLFVQAVYYTTKLM